MYSRLYPNRAGLSEEYKHGIAGFIAKAMTLNDFLIEGTIRCPCWNYKCCKLLSPDDVTLHLYRKGFMLNYTVWTAHGESSAANNFAFRNYVESRIRENNVESSQYSEMEYENGGKECPYLEVYEETHRKKNKEEEWRQTQPTSEDGTMVQPSPEEMNNMWTAVVGGSKKGRTYGTGVLQSSGIPWFPNSSSTLQTVEEMKAMKDQIVELTHKCAANDARFAKFDKLEELVKKHMPQLFHDEEDNESDDN
ncbi:hypothetical protein CQW23_13245 [Capsicum baccatum]|uniref:Transposase-associated domain-containing protein n=1 Tax=Capsicum baccatum TaxID=33114 RepID=A0A2G2WUX7_CAPBA|nr:hypothetical protein CQW23_13245 [Capsicum baccatum]